MKTRVKNDALKIRLSKVKPVGKKLDFKLKKMFQE